MVTERLIWSPSVPSLTPSFVCLTRDPRQTHVGRGRGPSLSGSCGAVPLSGPVPSRRRRRPAAWPAREPRPGSRPREAGPQVTRLPPCSRTRVPRVQSPERPGVPRLVPHPEARAVPLRVLSQSCSSREAASEFGSGHLKYCL